MISVRWWPPTPSQTRTCFWSVRHSASVPSSERSLRADLRAVSSVRPGPQRGRGEGGGVQGLEGGVFDGGAEAAQGLRAGRAPAEPEPGGQQREDRHAQPGQESAHAFTSAARPPQFLRQVEAGQDRRRAGRYPARGGQGHQHHGEEAERHRPERGPGEQGVQRAAVPGSPPWSRRRRGTRSRRRPACPAAAPGGVSRRHQMPSTSSGQKEDADTAKASPTASATGSPPTRTLAASGTAMARTVPSRKCRTPRDGQDVLGEHAGDGHGQPGGGGQERGEGAARHQRAQQVAAEAADHPLRAAAGRRRRRRR